MVLQQNTCARIWGWGTAGNVITVYTSWSTIDYTTQVGNNGKWELTFPTPSANYEIRSLTIREETKGKKARRVDSHTLNNILIGEVWFCSGQSNMEMPMSGFWNCPVEGANEAIAMSGKYRKALRCVTISKTGAQEPQDRVGGKWQVCEPKTAGSFSACGFFFARTLNDILDIPVGIINCSWGGSCVEGWLPKDTLLTYADGLTPIDDTDYHAKMIMYNGMLHPLAGYTIKGFLWNQGESNVGREKEYEQRFATMTRLWRKMWNQPDDRLPIYTVELPPYRYGDAEGTWGADFRAAQHRIAHNLENCGCVCTSDLIYEHEIDQIHGCRKMEIGRRLAYMAATRDYGVEGLASEAPEFEFWTMKEVSDDDKAVIAGSVVNAPTAIGRIAQLYFTNSFDGFDRMTGIEGFEAQDENGQWHKAVVWSASAWQNAERAGCFLKLSCPETKEIKNVRYCYKNFTKGTLHNMRGLPVVPFTTEK